MFENLENNFPAYNTAHFQRQCKMKSFYIPFVCVIKNISILIHRQSFIEIPSFVRGDCTISEIIIKIK